MKVSTFEKDGVKFPIFLHEDTGIFSTGTKHEDDYLEADTLEKLKEKINRSQRKKTVKLALPATLVESGRWGREGKTEPTLIDVNITGIHQRNRTILYRRADNNKADTVGYHDTMFRRLSAEQVTEYLKLKKLERTSREAVEAFEKKQAYDVEKVKAEVRKAEAAAGIEPSGDDD